MLSLMYLFVLSGVFILNKGCAAQDVMFLRRMKDCVMQEGSTICLKEKILDALNETINSDKPLSLFGVIDITKNPDYTINNSDEILPRDLSERNEKLNDMLYDKVEEFFESRSLRINLGSVFEGRGKKDKNKGGMMMMGGLAMAGMMAQMFMGKIAFMAGAALLVAKLALLLSTVIGFKKLSGGSSGGYNRSTMLILGGLAMTGLMMKIFMGKLGLAAASTLVASKLMIFMFFVAMVKLKKNKKIKHKLH